MSFIHFICIIRIQFRSWLSLEPHSWKRVGGWLIRADSHQILDSSVEMSNKIASTLASIQKFMAGVNRLLDQIERSRKDHHPVDISIDEIVPHASQTAHVLPPRTSHGVPFHLSDHCETAPPPTAIVRLPLLLLLMILDWLNRKPGLRGLSPGWGISDYRIEVWIGMIGTTYRRLAWLPSFACHRLSIIVGLVVLRST